MFDDKVMIDDEWFYPKLGYEKYSWTVPYYAKSWIGCSYIKYGNLDLGSNI
jgi:hypothetical protein